MYAIRSYYVEGAHVHAAEVVYGMVEDMELVLVVRAFHPADQPLKAGEGPAVDP